MYWHVDEDEEFLSYIQKNVFSFEVENLHHMHLLQQPVLLQFQKAV